MAAVSWNWKFVGALLVTAYVGSLLWTPGASEKKSDAAPENTPQATLRAALERTFAVKKPQITVLPINAGAESGSNFTGESQPVEVLMESMGGA